MVEHSTLHDEPTARQPLRVATWNMDHWKRTPAQRAAGWQALQSTLRADIALLQECVAPPALSRQRLAYREIGGTRGWGTAVVACDDATEVQEIGTVRTSYGAKRFPMLGTTPGTMMVARATIPGLGQLTCVSVYGMIDVYAQTTMLRIVADLIPLFDSAEGEHVVLGGDFNIDATRGLDDVEGRRYRAIINAVESLGLRSLAETSRVRPLKFTGCPCKQADCRHLNTYGSVQLDYLFATPALAARCTQVELPELCDLSDHRPIIAEFEHARLVNVRYDPTSFAAETAAQCGGEIGRVVEEIVDWAHRKHGLLERRSGVALDRLPIETKDEPELFVQLDLPRNRLQWMVSLRMNGLGVVHFQRMLGPFDTPERREQLWTELDEVLGGTLEKRLNGRPTFALRSLADGERLQRFLAILDRIVDETTNDYLR